MNSRANLNVIDVKNGKNEWLTPPWVIKGLGEFDLDPCSPVHRPRDTAKAHMTILDNGLLKEWFGRVWMNPPYGKELGLWLNRLCMHFNGIALTFARTDTNAFHNYVFSHADSLFFFRQRLNFLDINGKEFHGVAPSVLISYGSDNADAIEQAGFEGKHVPVNRIGIVIMGYDVTWRMVINTIFVRLNRPAELSELYNQVEAIAGDKVRGNPNFKAKVRQVVQTYFTRVSKATYSR